MKNFSRRGFLCLSLSALMTSFVSCIIAAETGDEWCFGVIPDTQWNSEAAPFHGTAVHVIDAINKEMIRRKVDFIIQVGDLVERSSELSFQTRAACNQPLEEAGIKYYPLRGNHDSADRDAVRQFKAAFPNLPGNEGCGGSSPDLPGMQGMTYSFTHKGGKFVLLDIFPVYDDGTSQGKAWSISEQQPWITEQLQADDHRFAMVFSHKNLLGQNHKDNLFGSGSDQNAPQDVQNAFYASLHDNGVKHFMSGHDHIYHRSDITSPDGQSQVRQIICGSAAHKFYTPQPPFMDRETKLAQELNRIGFLIVRVNQEGVQAEYYSTEPFGKEPFSPQWEIRDTFGYEFVVRD
ncbi:MAG: metallophosphoesterase [Planctomycetaceae bacterium]|nr:metallophosphoesterase [Planctomycetaceae bacterium]